MKRLTTFIFCFLIAAQMLATADLSAQVAKREKVANKVPFNAQSFDLGNVKLLDGPFREAMLRGQKYLLSLDNDRMLHNFRVNAGMPSSAKPLGGWEAPDVELRGHATGHLLTA